MALSAKAALLHPVTRWSGWAANGCLALAALFICGTLYQWLAASPQSLQTSLELKRVMLSPERRAICLGLALVPAAILSFGLVRLRGSFRCFSQGDLFSARAISGLRDFAAASAASVLIAAIASPLIALVLTWRGQHTGEAAFSVGTTSLTLLLISMLTWIFAYVLGLGAQLVAENDAFV